MIIQLILFVSPHLSHPVLSWTPLWGNPNKILAVHTATEFPQSFPLQKHTLNDEWTALYLCRYLLCCCWLVFFPKSSFLLWLCKRKQTQKPNKKPLPNNLTMNKINGAAVWCKEKELFPVIQHQANLDQVSSELTEGNLGIQTSHSEGKSCQ